MSISMEGSLLTEIHKVKNLCCVEFERGFVGSLLLGGNSGADMRASDLLELGFNMGLSLKAFTDTVCCQFMQAIVTLYRSKGQFDKFMVVNELINSHGGDGKEFREQALMLMDLVPTTAHAEHYLYNILDLAKRREIVEFCEKSVKMVRNVHENCDMALVLNEMEKAILALGDEHQTFSEWSVGLPRVVEKVREFIETGKNPDAGKPTGFRTLDAILEGLKPTEMTIIAARPSVGKTSLAMNIVANVACLDYPVGFFSLEMSKESLLQRAIFARLAYSKEVIASELFAPVQREQARESLVKAERELREKILFIDDRPHATLLQIASTARRMVHRHKVKLIVIDYLQLIAPETGARYQNQNEILTQISAGVKAMAKELNVPVIALSQLNREGAKDQRKVPDGYEDVKLSDLRGSGAIEQDADVVLLLHREEGSTNPDTVNVKIEVAKNRNGRTGETTLVFNRAKTQFSEEDPPVKK